MSPCLRRTQRPSFRSMAGISSMAEARSGQWGRVVPCPADTGGTGVATGGAPWGRWAGSGIPEQEVAVQRRPRAALFRGGTGSQNVIRRHCTGKASAVVGFARAVARDDGWRKNCGRSRTSCRRGSPPPGGRAGSGARGSNPFAAPCSGCRRPAAGLPAGSAPAGDEPRTGVSLFVAVVQQHLHADADAQQRFAAASSTASADRSSQLAHAVAHGALAGSTTRSAAKTSSGLEVMTTSTSAFARRG